MKNSRFESLKGYLWALIPSWVYMFNFGHFLSQTAAIIGVVLLTACGTPKEIIKTEYVYRDSLVVKTDTFTVNKIERVRDYTGLLDTLRLENSAAVSTSWVDTTNSTLKGQLEAKPVKIPVQIKEHYVYRDSIRTVEVEVPVEVEKIIEKKHVPFLAKLFSLFGIVSILYFGIRLYFKLKK